MPSPVRAHLVRGFLTFARKEMPHEIQINRMTESLACEFSGKLTREAA